MSATSFRCGFRVKGAASIRWMTTWTWYTDANHADLATFATFADAVAHVTDYVKARTAGLKAHELLVASCGPCICAEWEDRIIWTTDPKHPASKGYGFSSLPRSPEATL